VVLSCRIALAGATCLVVACAADEPPQSETFISLSPFSVLFGTLDMNLEQRLGTHHGVVIEGWYTVPGVQSIKDEKPSLDVGGELAYRYHFRDVGSGAFAGLQLKAGRIDAVRTNRLSIDTIPEDSYRMGYAALGLSAGWRWLFGQHFGATLRLGYGVPVVQWREWLTPPGDPFTRATNEAALTTAATLDAEISMAYRF